MNCADAGSNNKRQPTAFASHSADQRDVMTFAFQPKGLVRGAPTNAHTHNATKEFFTYVGI